jgi:two-component system phosphate regulon sensor histidine kinase PhoR
MLGALNDKARASQFVEAIVTNADRLSHLIADLLDIARIESGRMDLARVPVSVASVVERVRAALLPAVTDKRHTLAVDVDAGVQVEGDAKALEQIVTNLVDNAIKYTPRGGRISVRAQVAVDEGERDETGAPVGAPRDVVRLIVEDDGPGVAPEHQPRLFERFYRVDKGRAREEGGTGLGLAIVRHLAEAMGGDARVENNEPRGSRFIVTLPKAE